MAAVRSSSADTLDRFMRIAWEFIQAYFRIGDAYWLVYRGFADCRHVRELSLSRNSANQGTQNVRESMEYGCLRYVCYTPRTPYQSRVIWAWKLLGVLDRLEMCGRRSVPQHGKPRARAITHRTLSGFDLPFLHIRFIIDASPDASDPYYSIEKTCIPSKLISGAIIS